MEPRALRRTDPVEALVVEQVRHAESLAARCGLLYGDLWDDDWADAHN